MFFNTVFTTVFQYWPISFVPFVDHKIISGPWSVFFFNETKLKIPDCIRQSKGKYCIDNFFYVCESVFV